MKVVKINLGQTFLNIDDSGNMKDETGKDITAKAAIRLALCTELQQDHEGDSASQVDRRMKNFDLLSNIREAKETLVLSEEEANYLKTRVSMVLPLLISGPLLSALSKVKALADAAPVEANAVAKTDSESPL
jgi:hypothetical protein